jgi:hypothetical protein
MLMTLEEKRKVKTVKLRLILLDETKGWREDIQKACGKIFTPYMYDENQTVNLCELAPSYTLYPLPSFAENEISDEMHENLMDGDSNSSEPIFMHVSTVNAMTTKVANFSHRLDGGLRYVASEGKKYKQIIEAAEEYFKGNSPY